MIWVSTEDKPEKYRCVVYFVRQCIFPCDISTVYFSPFHLIELAFWCGFWAIYRGFPSFWTSIRELKSGLKRHRVVRDLGCRIVVFDWRERNNVWFELTGGSKTPGLKKSGLHCVLFFKRKIHHAARNLRHRCPVFSCTLCVVIAKVILR